MYICLYLYLYDALKKRSIDIYICIYLVTCLFFLPIYYFDSRLDMYQFIFSSSYTFIYQSIYFKKPIVQIFGNEIYWTNLNKQGLIICNNKSDLKKQITKFYYDKNFFRKNYGKKIIKLRSQIFNIGNVKINLQKKLVKLINQ